jgi:putative transcriptional regulator
MPAVPDVLAGRLLVAAPSLLDPSFARTVVLLLEHKADEGALGVVLSRPSRTDVAEVLPTWSAVVDEPSVVHVGGPVSPAAAIGLAAVAAGRAPELPADTFAPLPATLGGTLLLGTVDLDADPETLAPLLDSLRIFAGYAGWSVGQLEAEISEGAWYVVDALPHDAFAASPEGLWTAVLTRQGPPLSLVTRMPPDPSMN